ncbi:MAG: beta-lactamase family protein [Chromatiales bacterium]|nr:beta-lactamase family protein [Chromatiales bacterium]
MTGFAVGLLLGAGAPVTEAAGIAAELARRDWQDSPGLVYAAGGGGRAEVFAAHGCASLPCRRPLDPDTRFHAGSVAKTMTAYAVLRLAAEGRLELDHTLDQYLAVPEDWPAITLRQLLDHTSGLRDYWTLASLAGKASADLRTQAEALALVRRQHRLNFPPGSQFLYSNTGYLLLAEIVERSSGQPLATWLEQQVFTRLGMHDSLVQDEPLMIIPGLAAAYRRDAEGEVVPDPLFSGVTGSGNLVTTVADLLRWGEYLLGAEINGQALLELMAAAPELPDRSPVAYGLGIGIGQHRGRPSFHHGGANAGYRAHLMLLPEESLVVAVLTNAGWLRAETIAAGVADMALGSEAGPPDQALAPDEAEIFREHAGLYRLDNGALVSLRLVDTRPVLQIMGSAHLLENLGDNRYGLAGGEVTLSADHRRRRATLTLRLGDTVLSGQRQQPARVSAAKLRRISGDYCSPELAACWKLQANGDGLALEIPGQAPVRLAALRTDLYLEWDTADLVIRLHRDRRGRVRGFDVTVERVWQLDFERAR